MSGFRSALSFLTPLGGALAPGPSTLDWFPAAGLVLGVALGGIWWLSGEIWPAGLAAAILVTADLVLTGMLHFDGVVDAADGLLPHLDRGRRLEVMSSPEAGAFGLAAGGCVLLLRWAAAASVRPALLLIAGLWTLSRTSMAVVARTTPYARPAGGLASAFEGPVRPAPLIAGAATAIGLLLAWRPLQGLAVAAAAGAASGGVVAIARRRIGGYTGDVLGALGVLGETAGLVVAAAKW
jgi:adenosylcobinamide-GDP ribazoletransferase